MSRVPLARFLDRLIVSQVEQEKQDAANPEQAKNRRRSPWEVAAPIVLGELRAPGITVSDLRHHLVRQRYDGLDWSKCEGKTGEALADEIHAASLGGVQQSDPLSVELSRLEAEGFGDRLAEKLHEKFPEEVQAILAVLPPPPIPAVEIGHGDLAPFARDRLKGIERRIVEMLCEKRGECRLADMAADPGIGWNAPYDDAWNSARRRINKKLKSADLPWRLGRSDNAARLQRIGVK